MKNNFFHNVRIILITVSCDWVDKMYLLYSFIYTVVIIFLFPFEYFKRPRDLRKRWLREKLGSLTHHSSLITHHSFGSTPYLLEK